MFSSSNLNLDDQTLALSEPIVIFIPPPPSTMDRVQSLILDPLQPLLIPITNNLPFPIKSFLENLLGTPCYISLILHLSLTERTECPPLLISKALGIAIITASSIVKVPQILKLVRSKSAEGLSMASYALETEAFLITLAYNIRSGNPFSTYGEISLILAQDVIITSLILWFSNQIDLLGSFISGLAATAIATLYSSFITDSQMTTLASLAGLLGIASKVPQIWTNWKQGSTGQLSAFAVFNYLAGSVSRIFTTLQEVDDKVILYGFIAGGFLNAVLAAQMVWYWNSTGTAGHGREVPGSEKVKGKITAGNVVSGKEGVMQKEGAAATTSGYASPKPASQRRKA
jgi:mannose-P-dolichol utilization defect 1